LGRIKKPHWGGVLVDQKVKPRQTDLQTLLKGIPQYRPISPEKEEIPSFN